MLDRQWAKAVVEAARAELWSATAGAIVSAETLVCRAGLRGPRSEAERLLLLGIHADLRIKSTQPEATAAPVESAVTYLRTHSRTRGLTRAQVAKAVGVSESWLAHAFCHAVGLSFTRFLTDLRLADAVDLLASGSMSVKEVAAAAGFRSTSSFIRCFSLRFGMAPGAWRARRNTQMDVDRWS